VLALRFPVYAQPILEEFKCDLTLFQETPFPTTSFPTTSPNAGNSPNCKDSIPWFSFSAAVVSAPRTGVKRKDLSSFIASSKSPIAGLSQLAPTISLRQMNIAVGSAPTGPSFPDAGRIVQKDLDIAEYTDPVNNPMIPHVIVLEPGLVIYKIYNGYWFWGRPTLEDLRQDLRAVTKKCRPDWDITTPELKAAWRQGRKELFYPYGKTYLQTLGEQD